MKKKKTSIYKDVTLEISNGTKINIKIEDVALPITSSFVGMEKGEYILLSQPAPFSMIKSKLFPGNKLIAQYISNGMIYGFVGKIIEILSKPIYLIILEYPAKIMVQRLRFEDRTDCSLPVDIVFKGTHKNSVIRDINITGCRISVAYQPSEKNHIAKRSDALKISSRLPGTGKDILISGIVKNVKKKGLSVSYGIRFDSISADIQNSIKNYIATIQQ